MAVRLNKFLSKKMYAVKEERAKEFIDKGGKPAQETTTERIHRTSLRIPHSLMLKIDEKRKNFVGKVPRCLWILQALAEQVKK